MTSPRTGLWAERFRFGLTLVLIAATFLMGGGSRLDILSLMVLQPLAVLAGAAVILIPGEMRWTAIRTPLLLLIALALLMGAQLVPLPPALWSALPGRDQFEPFIEAAGAGSGWRPLSLTPDLTLASLVGLSVPAAGLLAFGSIPEERTHQLLPYILLAVAVSAILGLGQLVGGPNSAYYTYDVTNEGSAVGLFANRNHQALLVTMAWPMLAAWAVGSQQDRQRQQSQRWIAAVAAVGLIPLIIVIGSRAGLLLAIIGLLFAAWLLKTQGAFAHTRSTRPARTRRTAALLAVGAVAAVILTTIFVSRDEALQRLYTMNVSNDVRVEYLPVLIRITGDFLPFGSGFGSFDPVFRYYEPDALLQPLYLNHAHNDWLELVMTGGLPAVGIALLFLFWVSRCAIGLRESRPGSGRARFGHLAVALIVMAFIASTVDYPLRTPIHALLLAFAAAWLGAARVNRNPRTRP